LGYDSDFYGNFNWSFLQLYCLQKDYMENKKIGLSVVIPTLNEEQRILSNVSLITSYLDEQNYDWEIIVSDNGSTDKTPDLVLNLSKKDKRIKLLTSIYKGKGPAVRRGVLEATKENILFTDADLAVPIKELNRLILWITEQNYDVAIASREGLGAFRKGEPYIRHFMGRVFNALVQTIVISGFQDTQCGFKLFKADIAKTIFDKMIVYKDFTKQPKPYVGAFDVEVLLIAKILGYKIKDVPIVWTYVPTQRISHIRDSVKMTIDIIRIRYFAVRGKYK
jgi:glycosyltransferase involved in cell wall biosynthesis